MRGVGVEALTELRAGSKTIIGALLGVMIGISALPYYSFGIFLSAIETNEGWGRGEIALAQGTGARCGIPYCRVSHR
jgi:hypothetical protein